MKNLINFIVMVLAYTIIHMGFHIGRDSESYTLVWFCYIFIVATGGTILWVLGYRDGKK